MAHEDRLRDYREREAARNADRTGIPDFFPRPNNPPYNGPVIVEEEETEQPVPAQGGRKKKKTLGEIARDIAKQEDAKKEAEKPAIEKRREAERSESDHLDDDEGELWDQICDSAEKEFGVRIPIGLREG
jgi:hypothetical protein